MKNERKERSKERRRSGKKERHSEVGVNRPEGIKKSRGDVEQNGKKNKEICG